MCQPRTTTITARPYEALGIVPRALTCPKLKQGGEREVLLGVDDDFIKAARWRRIPRSDVAELAVQALTLASATNRCATLQ